MHLERRGSGREEGQTTAKGDDRGEAGLQKSKLTPRNREFAVF